MNGRETDRKTIRVDAHFSEDEKKKIVWKLKYTVHALELLKPYTTYCVGYNDEP